VERVGHLSVGDGFDPGIALGPLIDIRIVAKIEAHITDAIAKGGAIRCGGERVGANGTFFQPTVLTGISGEMKVAQEETFGPLAPIIRFEDADRKGKESGPPHQKRNFRFRSAIVNKRTRPFIWFVRTVGHNTVADDLGYRVLGPGPLLQ
jgi:hypothetical protein